MVRGGSVDGQWWNMVLEVTQKLFEVILEPYRKFYGLKAHRIRLLILALGDTKSGPSFDTDS